DGGNDTLTGFGGHDSFDFTTGLDAVNNVPTITDFIVGSDKIGLSAVVFATLSGQLQAAQFFTGPAAHAPDDRIIYNADTSALMYDSNGNMARVALHNSQSSRRTSRSATRISSSFEAATRMLSVAAARRRLPPARP